MALRYQIIPVTHYQQNCSLIWCDETQHAAVVDPGGDIDQILAAVAERGLTLEKVLLTHGHMDHCGGVAALLTHVDIPVVGPQKEDLFWIQGLEQQAQMMGFANVAVFSPSQWLNGGEQVTVGKQTLNVVYTPGHTPGHVVFYSETAKLAWVGDVLFQGSIGRTDFPKGNFEQLVESITQRLWPLGDDIAFIPGHGPMSTFGHERKTNPFVADHKFG